jgi:hypothetical protein
LPATRLVCHRDLRQPTPTSSLTCGRHQATRLLDRPSGLHCVHSCGPVKPVEA